MPKLQVYLDTSVISALYDERNLLRQAQTVRFWDRAERFDLATSDVGRIEIEDTPDEQRRALMLRTLSQIRVLPVTSEMNRLAERYLLSGAFTSTMRNDSLHVAAAVLSDFDLLVSWNFRHLVNRRRKAAVNM